jgi:hypothetical protein
MPEDSETAALSTKRWILFAVWGVYCVFIFEFVSQLYCYLFTDLPPFAEEASTLGLYPELEAIPDDIASSETFDVLLLGGSVLWEWARRPYTAHRLARLRVDGRPVRISLAARPGHTSLDSLYKLRHLSDQSFDLYILYQGINEVRTNNVPPQHWRSDYSHYSWYAEANFLQRNATVINAGLRSPVVWFRLQQLVVSSLGIREFVPTDWPDEEFLLYGSDIRSAGPFRRNIERMLDIAADNGTPFLLSTFAWYRPDDYDIDNYRRPHPVPEDGVYRDFFVLPIELWGRPDDVVRALESHNEILRSMHRHPAVLDVVPMEARIPKNEKFFEDICHLTERGYVKFGDNLIVAMLKAAN